VHRPRSLLHASPALFEDDHQGYGAIRGDGQVSIDTAEDAKRAEVGCAECAVMFERDGTLE
jgi:hypothetical protein